MKKGKGFDDSMFVGGRPEPYAKPMERVSDSSQAAGSVSARKLIDHLEFFKLTLDGSIKLCNDQDGDIFASWKVGGQDFYIYGKKQND